MGDPRSQNFYSVLGIPKSASLPDISKAYKSLVMKWHPDKNSSNKAEAEAKFKAINEAYRVLSMEKREENSRFGNEPTTPTKMEDIFHHRSADQSFFSRSGSRRSHTPTPPSPRSFSRNVSRRSTTPTPADFYASLARKEEILKIKVKPGWKKGTKITFEGKGDERPGTLPADIIFVIDEKRHPLFKREGDDLELGVEISLVDALTGCTITVPLLGGEEMTLSLDDIIYPGYEKIVSGQGMPKPKELGKRGDLRLKFLVEFPAELSDEQRSDTLSILAADCS
ncbi:hypothetical protein F0562_029029 [Nyssa sinensis]|uniref:J domain-containing protein n=1 Tax=Nyssa sinensis TaxID=561372 RepID=A0A5J5B5X4_9ASTE|nr:hypothetical protein F0562_029029 [Nyssa sinensis]